MKKRIWATLLAVCLAVGLLLTTAWAVDDQPNGLDAVFGEGWENRLKFEQIYNESSKIHNVWFNQTGAEGDSVNGVYVVNITIDPANAPFEESFSWNGLTAFYTPFFVAIPAPLEGWTAKYRLDGLSWYNFINNGIADDPFTYSSNWSEWNQLQRDTVPDLSSQGLLADYVPYHGQGNPYSSYLAEYTNQSSEEVVKVCFALHLTSQWPVTTRSVSGNSITVKVTDEQNAWPGAVYEIFVSKYMSPGEPLKDVGSAKQDENGCCTFTATDAGDYHIFVVDTSTADEGNNILGRTLCDTSYIAAAPEDMRNITIIPSENGGVSCTPNKACAGNVVVITVTSNKGYQANAPVVKDASGNTISATRSGENIYAFVMPDADVTVEGVFATTGPVGVNGGYTAYPAADRNNRMADGYITIEFGKTGLGEVKANSTYLVQIVSNGQTILFLTQSDSTSLRFLCNKVGRLSVWEVPDGANVDIEDLTLSMIQNKQIITNEDIATLPAYTKN